MTPLHKNKDPKVAIKDGRPIFATSKPFKKPIKEPAIKAQSKLINALLVDNITLEKTKAEKAIVDGKDKSISAQIITNVIDIARMTDIGVMANIA
jgi:hypothetical protein